MEFLCSRAHCVSLPIPSPVPIVSPRPASLFKPLRHSSAPPIKSKRPLTLRASRDSPFSPNPFSSLLKPAALALAAAAAAAAVLLPHRLPKPSLASVPAPLSEPLPADEEEESEQFLEARLADRPDDAQALRALMEHKVKSRRLPEAVAIADRLIRLDPADKDLPLLKAHLQTYAGDDDAARRGFEAVLAADPLAVEAYHGLVLMASRSDSGDDLQSISKKIETAIELCKREKRNDALMDFRLLAAQIRVIDGDYEEALGIYQDLAREEPRDFRPYLCQGIIYTLMRKQSEAEKQFDKYQRLVPKGHPYAKYFEENMMAMNAFSQMAADRKEGAAQS